VRDEHPRLERELEAARRLGAPPPQRLDARRLVEGLLHLDDGEETHVLGPRHPKAAAPDFDFRGSHQRR
jgi:hypothetical protein